MGLATAEIDYYAPEFSVEINGKKTTAEVSKVITSVTIEQELNKTNNFRFEVQDELREGGFRWLGRDVGNDDGEHDLFKFGNNISIYMGYVQNMHKLIEGKIQNIKASFTKGLSPTFSVEGSDSTYDFLMTKSKSEVFRDKKDSDIVKKIAQMGKIKYKAIVDDTKEKFPIKTKRGGKSYFEFIKHMAESNPGFVFYLSGRDLYFVKAGNDKEAKHKLKWGAELINFQPTLNTTKLISEVVVRSWDVKKKKLIEGSAKVGEETKQEKKKQLSSQLIKKIHGDVIKVITDRPVRSVKEAKKVAKSELEKAGNNFIKGSAQAIGIPELRPGVCVNLEGLGKWFSGKYYIEKVTHRIDTSGYRTNFNVCRNSL